MNALVHYMVYQKQGGWSRS